MRYATLLLIAAVGTCCLPTLQAAPPKAKSTVVEFEQQKPRAWKVNGKFIYAKLVSYDKTKRLAKLKTRQGKEVTASRTKLPAVDRRYLDRQVVRAAQQRRKANRGGFNPGRGGKTAGRGFNQKPFKGGKLRGVHWYTNTEAAAKEATKDDEPILMFRAVGELDGCI